MPTSVTAYEDSQGGLWPTLAEAEDADRKYNANILFEAQLDEERQTISFATLDDLITMRSAIQDIFDALDGV